MLGKKKKEESENVEAEKENDYKPDKDGCIIVDRPSGFGTVSIRRMKAKDEDIIGDTARAKNGKSLDDFLKSITGVDDSEYQDWPLGDKMSVLLDIRKFSKGTEYSFEVGCPFCNKTQEVVIDLNKLKILKFKEEGMLDDDLYYDLTLPYSGKKIKRKILKVKDEKDIRNGHLNHSDHIMSYLTMIQTVEIEDVKIRNINTRTGKLNHPI